MPLSPESVAIGATFGRLAVIQLSVAKGRRRWLCLCACGAEVVVLDYSLRSGNTTSCGCFRREVTVARNRKHDAAWSLTWRSWHAMRQRVRPNAGEKHRRRYYERGVVVCDRWASFGHFLADMGERPSAAHSIDRINNDGNYEPGNCRWATPVEQAANRLNLRTKGGRYAAVT